MFFQTEKIIFGVNKSSQDASEVSLLAEDIFNKIGIEPSIISHSRRFRRVDASKPAPIFVRLYKVIAAAKKLRSFAEFKNVCINPDR